MKPYIIVILLLVSFGNVSAQEGKLTARQELKLESQHLDNIDVVPSVFKTSFLPLGFSFEQRIAKFQTIHITGNLNFNPFRSLYYSQNNFDSRLFVNSTIKLQYRYYFNLKARAIRGYTTANNSGLFVGFHGSYRTPIFNPTPSYYFGNTGTTGLIFGVQRSTKRNINIDFAIGPGAVFFGGRFWPTVVGNIAFSYIIVPSRKAKKEKFPVFDEE